MERYTIEMVLAEALYGQVLLCTDTFTGEQVAIKRMNIAAATAKRTLHGVAFISEDIAVEKQVHHALSANGGHPNVLAMRDNFVQDGHDHFVLDYCTNGELFDMVEASPNQRFDLEFARRMFRQVASGVAFIHARGFAHRDLSLENVLVDGKGTCHICDFGLATSRGSPSFETVGKAFYMAPEVYLKRGYDAAKADMWSLGIMLFMMLTGAPLVEVANASDSRFQYFETYGLATLLRAWNLAQVVHGDVLGLLQQLLALDPTHRPSIDQILAHPFVAEVKQAAKGTSSMGHVVKGFFARRRSSNRLLDVYNTTM
ncbi:Aste57867_8975 [Aphanomyces stellatus]|uniref:Aste57867_8975 protein n=1 Tax=Aphanomyces stellatus TaxID=120398 RepID=A0A485KLL2_9STRA|nr:hypothetical protein As57867_008940 [Aphanomyces stellatus]VFT85859.1 Aste57867_8975 [Aphanomyces stellatus]